MTTKRKNRVTVRYSQEEQRMSALVKIHEGKPLIGNVSVPVNAPHNVALEQFIGELQKIGLQYPDAMVSTKLDISYYDDAWGEHDAEIYLEVTGQRELTEKELRAWNSYNEKLKENKKREAAWLREDNAALKLKREEQEKEQYERLKKKFEGK